MSKLWAPNPEYDESKPQSLCNMPYKRLYKRLTPDELSELLRDAEERQWKALDLSRTKISALPDSITRLTSLQSLYLRDTPISALPDSVGNLTSLQALNLRGCHLKAIPYSLVTLGLPFVIDDTFAGNCIN